MFLKDNQTTSSQRKGKILLYLVNNETDVPIHEYLLILQRYFPTASLHEGSIDISTSFLHTSTQLTNCKELIESEEGQHGDELRRFGTLSGT